MKERILEKWMFHEVKIKSVTVRVVDILFILCIWALAGLARIKLLYIETPDYTDAFGPWMQQIRANGGFKALGTAMGDYTSPYLYLMCLVSYFVSYDLYALKFISIVFDYVACIAVFAIVWQHTHSLKKSILGMSMLLLSPAVLVNGAYWCQCDIIYTTLILYGIYYVFKDRGAACLIMIGLAFSFKLQTLFILPFVLMLWLKRESVKLVHFLWIPAIYVIMQIPAAIMGRDFGELLTVYFGQGSAYTYSSLNFPNIYYLLDESMAVCHNPSEVSNCGLYVSIALFGLVTYYIYTKRFRFTNDIKLLLAIFTAGLAVYTLPHMHERYGFLFDALTIVYVAIKPKKIVLWLCTVVSTLAAYSMYLYGYQIIDYRYVSLLNLGMLVYVGRELYREIQKEAVS